MAAEENILSTVGNKPIIVRVEFSSEEGMEKVQSFSARKGDVFISTFPKTGTTFLQQVLHQIRTGGNVNFDEITEVVPWFEAWPSLGADLNDDHIANPRCFKSHQCLSQLSHLEKDGAKYICTIRDPETTILSYFKFLLSHKHPLTSTRNINDFLNSIYILGGENEDVEPHMLPVCGGIMWNQYIEYWNCRNFKNVEVFAFEDLTQNLQKYLDRLSSFLGLKELTNNQKKVVLQYCSKSWMMENGTQFDDHCLGQRLLKIGSSMEMPAVSKVGHDVSSDNLVLEFNEKSKEIFNKMWKEKIQPVTGFATYKELQNALVPREHFRTIR